jgi:hypothetical protein
MAAREKLRGRQTVLPEWWLLELQIAVRRRSDEKLADGVKWTPERIGRDLAELAERNLDGKLVPWDRKSIDRFLDGKNPTQEIVDAFVKMFPHLIQPTFVATSRAEALDLARTAARYTNPAEITERERRSSELRVKRAEIEADQTRHVESGNVVRQSASRVVGGGRSRRVGRGGSSSS